MINGNKYQGDLDFRTADSPLMFKRHYNSINTGFNLGLGQGWRNTYDVSVIHQSSDRIVVIQSDGRIIHFRRSIEEPQKTPQQTQTTILIYIPTDPNDGIINRTADSLEWLLADGRRFSFKGPFLTKIETPNGQSVSLYYQNQQLHHVTDHLGRVLTLLYTPGLRRNTNLGLYSEDSPESDGRNDTNEIKETNWPGYIEAIELPGGQLIEYKYDNRGQLVKVKYPEGKVTGYRYANNLFNGILTERRENGQAISQWQYDEASRVIRSDNLKNYTHLKFDYSDTESNSAAGSTTVTDHTGGSTRYEWQRVGPEVYGVVNAEHDESSYRISKSMGEKCVGCPEFATEHLPSVVDTHANSSQKERLIRRGIEVLENDPLGYPSSIRLSDIGRHKQNPKSGSTHIYAVKFDSRGKILELKSEDKLAEALKFRGRQAQQDNGSEVIARQLNPARLELLGIAVDLEKAMTVQPRQIASNIRNLIQQPQSSPQTTNTSQCAFLTCDELERADFYFDFASCAYEDSNTCPVPAGWERVDPMRAGYDNNSDISDLVIDGEFAATIYHNVAENRVIIAYRGSNGNVIRDYAAGVGIFSGSSSEQADAASELAMMIDTIYPSDTLIETTGHSLGGGLAIVGAASLGIEGVVFGSFGVARETAHLLGTHWATNNQIEHFYIDGDLVVEKPQDFGFDAIQGEIHQMPQPVSYTHLTLSTICSV